jgi:TRAP-type C4-dicarboxylate transport system permease large subunit
MYGGLATPSEAAAVGVLGAAIVTALQGSLTFVALREVAIGSVTTCSMIAIIVLGASILSNAAAFLGIPRAIADWVSSLGLSPFMLIVALIVFYPRLLSRRLFHDRHDTADRHANHQGRRL